MSLTANQAYEFTITGLSQYAQIELGTAAGLAADGASASAIVSTSPGSAATQNIYFMPSTSGTYYVDLSDSYGVVPESYTVSVVTTTADYTDNPTHPGSLAVGGTAKGKLTNVGQHDWVAVTLTANQAYEFTITGLSQYAEVAVGTAEALSGDGTVAFAVPSTDAGLGSAATLNMYFMPSASGTYYVDLSDGYGVVPESYTLNVVTTTADYTDNPTHPGSLAVGGSTTGELTNIGQHDWVAVTLTANQAYEFTITGLSQYAQIELGTAAGLSGDGDGAFAIPSTDTGLGSAVTQNMYFMPSVSGTYYVDLSDGYATVPESYTLSVVTTTADYTDNPTHPGAATIGGPPPPPTDFYGNGHSDLLLQNSSGEPFIYEMNGTSVAGGGSLTNPGPSWHIKATGDFNDDGYADILGQNDNGAVAIWEMNGTTVIGGGSIGNPGPSWHAIATGDFYDNGYSDILFQNSNGEAYIWEMNGTTVIGGGSVGNPGPSWHAVATGDFYDNGYSDILCAEQQRRGVHLGVDRHHSGRRRQPRQSWAELARRRHRRFLRQRLFRYSVPERQRGRRRSGR